MNQTRAQMKIRDAHGDAAEQWAATYLHPVRLTLRLCGEGWQQNDGKERQVVAPEGRDGRVQSRKRKSKVYLVYPVFGS
ncbi:hypothetical protein MBR_00589, partial [Metarhizium brunneum ARSEF 3297]